MQFFVNIHSESLPILECSFLSIDEAKNFYKNILNSGYSISGEKYSIAFGYYLLDLEEEYIYEKAVIGKNQKDNTVSKPNSEKMLATLTNIKLSEN